MPPRHPAQSALSDLDLNVGVRSASDLVVDNNYAQLQAGADVRLVGSPVRPGLIGSATLREGGQIFLGGNTWRNRRRREDRFHQRRPHRAQSLDHGAHAYSRVWIL